MELINLEDVKQFIGNSVEIVIQNEEGGDQAAAVRKPIKKIQYCPDKTHIRFYFDDFYFFAVPAKSKVNWSNDIWSAYDADSELTYKLKKVQVF
ncbi:hypothetical protein V7128_04315 [Neobacillus vireti]|uniref:hypothetical protein n=1 Tax=Neobacillus vireti TaxID=220686 RepID=UPI002FFE09D6